MRVHFCEKSRNSKTGPIPVSTTSSDTCPQACPFRGNGCYAESGPLALHWREVNNGTRGDTWPEFCAKVEALPAGQLWRHNQAGDLPGKGDSIDVWELGSLVKGEPGQARLHLHTQADGTAGESGRGRARECGRLYHQCLSQ